MPFPISPVDGQEYQTTFGSRYKYYQSDDKWVKIGFPLSGVTGPRGIEGGYTGIYNITVEGGTNVVSTGTKTNLTMPFDLKLDDWRVLASDTGTIYFSLYKGTYTDYPPSVEMHAGETGPHIINGIKNKDDDLSDWTYTEFDKGDVLRVDVVGAQTITNATLSFNYHKIEPV